MSSTSSTVSAALPSHQRIGLSEEHVRARRKARGRWRVAMILACVAVVAGGAWAGRTWVFTARAVDDSTRFVVKPQVFSVVLKEKGELKAAKSTDIKSEVEGRSTIITLVPEGTAVKEGDLLVELASDQINDRIRSEELKEANALTAYEASKTELEIQRDKNASDIRKAELQIDLRQLELDKYLKGDWEQRHRDAEIEIDRATISLARCRQDFEAAKQLKTQNFITQAEYDEDEFEFKKAAWDLEKANKAKEVLEAYSHKAELRQRESDRDEAVKEADRVRKNAAAEEIKKERAWEGAEKELSIIRDQLAKFRHQRDKCRITAPTQGFVVYSGGGGGGGFRMMSGDGQIKEGAEVFERQVLIELPDTTEMMVVVRIHEAKTDRLKIGQSVVVEVEGVPGRRFTGKVSKIAVLADTQNRWLNPDLKEYETEITLDPSDVALKPGVTAHAEIFVESVENRLSVPVHSVYSKAGKRFVFRHQDGQVKPVEVSLGSVGTEWVEVTQGLADGDVIALAANDELKRLLPEGGPGDRPRQGMPGVRAQGQTGGGERPAAVIGSGSGQRPPGRPQGQGRGSAPASKGQ